MCGSFAIGSWVEIREGCPIKFTIGGSDLAYVVCGPDSSDSFQLNLDSEALREFAHGASAALREMEAIFAREEAEEEQNDEDS